MAQSKRMVVKLSESEHEQIARFAEEAGVSVSHFVRQRCLADMQLYPDETEPGILSIASGGEILPFLWDFAIQAAEASVTDPPSAIATKGDAIQVEDPGGECLEWLNKVHRFAKLLNIDGQAWDATTQGYALELWATLPGNARQRLQSNMAKLSGDL